MDDQTAIHEELLKSDRHQRGREQVLERGGEGGGVDIETQNGVNLKNKEAPVGTDCWHRLCQLS